MPARPQNRHRYPADWKTIALAVKEDDAGRWCECAGERGSSHSPDPEGRCPDEHGKPAHDAEKPIVLTCAHLSYVPQDVRRENLAAVCAPCHLRYAAARHAETRARTMAQAREAGTTGPGTDITSGGTADGLRGGIRDMERTLRVRYPGGTNLSGRESYSAGPVLLVGAAPVPHAPGAGAEGENRRGDVRGAAAAGRLKRAGH